MTLPHQLPSWHTAVLSVIVLQQLCSQVADDVQSTLSEQREVYRPLAAKGASMFFVMCDLHTMNNMYRFSLAMFLSLFTKVSKNPS